jgi:hypothetical protein
LRALDETRAFWSHIPARGLLPFLAGVACSFAVIGFANDIALGGRTPALRLAASVISASVIAVLMALSFVRSLRLLPLAAGAMLAQFALIDTLPAARGPETPAEVRARLRVDASGSVLCMSLAYAFFVAFIARDGRTRVRQQAEIGLAREIHQALVPRLRFATPAGGLYGESRPASEVGGDLVDALPIGNGALAYVADVSGHGVPAGILMGMLKSATRMRLLSGCDPEGLLVALNTVLWQVKRPNMFATAACLWLEPGRLDYALAGHPPLLHYQASSGRVERLAGGGAALGILEGVSYARHSVVLAPGDVLAVVTDGLAEVMDRGDRELGLEPLEAELVAGAKLPLPELCERLVARARRHGPQQDDQTLLLVRAA